MVVRSLGNGFKAADLRGDPPLYLYIQAGVSVQPEIPGLLSWLQNQ